MSRLSSCTFLTACIQVYKTLLQRRFCVTIKLSKYRICQRLKSVHIQARQHYYIYSNAFYFSDGSRRRIGSRSALKNDRASSRYHYLICHFCTLVNAAVKTDLVLRVNIHCSFLSPQIFHCLCFILSIRISGRGLHNLTYSTNARPKAVPSSKALVST